MRLSLFFSSIFASEQSYHFMKTRYKEQLTAKCKDMGLTDKAINELVELGSKGLEDGASDEDIIKAVDSVVPFAKAMQGEITRKTQKKPKQEPKSEDEGGESKGNVGNDEIQKLLSGFQERLDKLETENTQLREQRAASERNALIAEKAKALGIPDYLIKRVSFATDADLDKELADFKQDLVNANLVPKEQAREMGTTDDALKADAKTWAQKLPNA